MYELQLAAKWRDALAAGSRLTIEQGPPMEEDERELQQLCAELRRRDRSREPVKIAEVMSQLLARKGYLQSVAADELAAAWKSAAGALAQGTRVGKVRRGRLEVFVEESTSIQELTFQKRQILKKLVALFPQCKVSDLRFRAGGAE